MDEQNGRENLKAVWKYYVLAFAGLGLLWLGSQVQPPLKTGCNVLGAVCFLAGVLLTLYWDRNRKAKEDRENTAPAAKNKK